MICVKKMYRRTANLRRRLFRMLYRRENNTRFKVQWNDDCSCGLVAWEVPNFDYLEGIIINLIWIPFIYFISGVIYPHTILRPTPLTFSFATRPSLITKLYGWRFSMKSPIPDNNGISRCEIPYRNRIIGKSTQLALIGARWFIYMIWFIMPQSNYSKSSVKIPTPAIYR